MQPWYIRAVGGINGGGYIVGNDKIKAKFVYDFDEEIYQIVFIADGKELVVQVDVESLKDFVSKLDKVVRLVEASKKGYTEEVRAVVGRRGSHKPWLEWLR